MGDNGSESYLIIGKKMSFELKYNAIAIKPYCNSCFGFHQMRWTNWSGCMFCRAGILIVSVTWLTHIDHKLLAHFHYRSCKTILCPVCNPCHDFTRYVAWTASSPAGLFSLSTFNHFDFCRKGYFSAIRVSVMYVSYSDVVGHLAGLSGLMAGALDSVCLTWSCHPSATYAGIW